MSTANLFGPIVHGGQVEQAAKETLQTWMPAYIAELERLTDRDPEALPMVRAFVNTPEFDKWPEDQLPCVVLICPGTATEPTQDGDGSHRARWQLHVATIVSASTEAATLELAKVYSAAVRAVLVQHATLGGFALKTVWVGESYDDLPLDKRRSLAAGEVMFVVEVDDVLDGDGGPVTVPADPYLDPGDWPTALTAVATVDHDDT